MQSSGGSGAGSAAGHGRNPAATPTGRSPSSSSASPSSSSSTHVGLESIQQQQLQQQQQQQQQHQLAFRQSLQQQQLRKPEGEESLLQFQSGGGAHGPMARNNFPSSSSGFPRKFGGMIPQHGAPQNHDGHNKGQGLEQHAHNPMNHPYLQYAAAAFQAAQQKSLGSTQPLQQSRIGMGNIPGRDQDARVNTLKMQEFISANQAHASMIKKAPEQLSHIEKQTQSFEQRSEVKPPQAMAGQSGLPNITRPGQSIPSQPALSNIPSNQVAIAQFQAMKAWALENNIDLSLPANANLLAQLLPAWQSRMAGLMKPSEGQNTATHQAHAHLSKQQAISSPVESESSAHGSSVGDFSGQPGSSRNREMNASISAPASSNIQSQFADQGKESQNDKAGRYQIAVPNGVPAMHPPQHTSGMNQVVERSNQNPLTDQQTLQMQYFRQMQQFNKSAHQSGGFSSESAGNQLSPSGGLIQMPQQFIGFTKQQLHVLKAQILAFRRLKIIVQRGEGAMPEELLRAIVPPPLDPQNQQACPVLEMTGQERNAGRSAEDPRSLGTNDKSFQPSPLSQIQTQSIPKDEKNTSTEEKVATISNSQGRMSPTKEIVEIGAAGKLEQKMPSSLKSEVDSECETQNNLTGGDTGSERVESIPPQNAVVDAGQIKKPPLSTSGSTKDATGSTRKYHGPLFDFPCFTRKLDSFGSTTSMNNANNLTLAYDVGDLLYEEGLEIFGKKRLENLRKIDGILAIKPERKRIRPDLVLRLQIEQRKLRLLDLQARLRDEVDQQQHEIMTMPDRPYRKFVRQCERQRVELVRQVQLSQKLIREKQLKGIFQWRKKLLEAHWAIRDARTTRNRGIAKYHERMLREFSKRKDDYRNKRMEALKNNDVDRYREMLLEQQTNIPGDAAQRYTVLSSFLSQTEEYLHKLGGKITAAKNHQEVEEAANVAAAAARSQGLSEEEVKAAAACAGEEVMIRNRFSEMNAPNDNLSVNKYYNLAHAVNERVVKQPSMLRAGTLRDYQIVGLQWMLSLYNNKLNGILADEMGLGKTVQVMSLIAYLMEFKGNYGPHLIIVPNAVLVNWKGELHNWLPSASCIFYVGSKDQRSKLFSQEVCALKFNILVTTYEFIMYDRSKLSKVDWKYIIIDEAQRMKDRESVLARDLDRYRCQRRLLLTGTPLQNDLKELWSLLNLLLPEVFDNRKAFHDWFAKPFQRDGPSHTPEEDDWLETEKKVIIIHRLHQILEPFMLRRRVEDVEGSLPRKVSIVLRCRMSAVQGAIYDWIKSTGTIRVDPDDELRRSQKNPLYQIKVYKNLNNKCMELRKACNHPLLNYPYYSDYSKDFIVRSCGKLWILDRILIKLQKAGHRVLLFSTMTRLLDILEEYLQWRKLIYRRIDGTTSLEDRESAIVDFNSRDSDCFIFLLSIRAAGRGLNLQTADTVIIYDPDPNPQNEEQAVARAHRIGQKREVKVIYMEAVVDKISSHQKEDELRNGGAVDSEDDLAGKDRYMGSIESLIRNNIQQYKIDMADEVINAGRFDQRTTHEERRMTLETLLHDEERYQETVHDVPSLQEVNRMIARSEEEIEMFDQMDEEFEWSGEMMKYNQVPKWLRAGSREVNVVISSLSKKPSKNILAGNINIESGETVSGLSPNKTERRRGRPRGLSDKTYSIYRELDDEDVEDSDESSDERNVYSMPEEEGEIGEDDDEEFNVVIGVPPSNMNHSEEGPVCDGDAYEFSRDKVRMRSDRTLDEAHSSGSSSGARKLAQLAMPTSQKFGSLSALDSKPGAVSNRMDELEEGEIALSGDSHMYVQQSGSWTHDRDDGEDEQVLQPKIKRKRSLRIRPRYTSEKFEEKSTHDRGVSQRLSQPPLPVNQEIDPVDDSFSEPISTHQDLSNLSSKAKNNLPRRKVTNAPSLQNIPKATRSNCFSSPVTDAADHSRESWNGKAVSSKMPDIVQRKCKNVINKLQRRVDKDGQEIIPSFYAFWRRQSLPISNCLLDLKRIDQRVDGLEYISVSEFIADVQLMLRNMVQFCGCTYEVKLEARKLHDLFFDIMKIAFPDTDFREAKNPLTFLGSVVATATPSSLQAGASQSKRHKLISNVDPGLSSKRPVSRATSLMDDITPSRGHMPKFQMETMPPSSSQSLADCSPFPSHPGDLVVCKRKRNDRDKSSSMQRMGGPLSPFSPSRVGSASPFSPGRLVPVSPPSLGRSGPMSPSNSARGGPVSPLDQARTVRVPLQKDLRPGQREANYPLGHAQHRAQQSDAGGGLTTGVEAKWAKPVKRMRTDTGRRRPSHF